MKIEHTLPRNSAWLSWSSFNAVLDLSIVLDILLLYYVLAVYKYPYVQ